MTDEHEQPPPFRWTKTYTALTVAGVMVVIPLLLYAFWLMTVAPFLGD